MAMNDADWYKIFPAKYLSVAGRIPNGTQRAEFLLIVMHCLEQGPLPNDDEEIAFITAIDVERITALRPYLNRLCKADGNIIIPCLAEDTIAERIEFGAKKATGGRKGGKQTEAEPSTAKQEQAQPSTAKHGKTEPSQANNQTDRQTIKQEGMGGGQKKEVPPVEAFGDVFAEVFPGLVTDERANRMLVSLAMQFNATPAQIRGFPAWLARNHPRKALNHWAFRDHFHQSLNGDLKRGNDGNNSKPPANASLDKFKAAREI